MSEETKPGAAKPSSHYLRWRVTQEERSELVSIKMQGYWRNKDDVEFVDYLVQLGKRIYINQLLMGHTKIFQTTNYQHPDDEIILQKAESARIKLDEARER